MFLSLGTFNSISVYDFDDESVVTLAADRVREIHARFSAFSAQSDISAINSMSGAAFVPVHQETICLLQRAKEYARLTGGIFDPTIRPLVKLWNIGGNSPRIPNAQEIRDALKLISAEDILIDVENSAVMLRRDGQALDLGGIAKGYAADEARRILLEHGVREATINFGGTVITLGHAQQVGIQHPDFETGTPMGTVLLDNQAAVTSGCYEKYFMRDGKRYHHLFDPHTGYPADSGLKSVTLIGCSALELDALTTAIFVLGAEKSRYIIDRFQLEAIFITTENQLFVTGGIKEGLTVLSHMRRAV